jgi:endonuclease/exonuclease/phosphatase family metal-dependent hydrolase
MTNNELVKVATINTLNNREFYGERTITIFNEAVEKGVDILLFQEVLPEYVAELKIDAQKFGFDFSHVVSNDDTHHQNQNAIFSRLEFTHTSSFNTASHSEALRAAVACVNVNDRSVFIISAHLCWGAHNGHIRLEQTRTINKHAVNMQSSIPNSIVILGGDLNDEPEASSIQYLKGKYSAENIQSAFWVDATARTQWEQHHTSRPYSEWGVKTARKVGILDPLQVPERKIDYLFVLGWVYGNPGMPSNASLFGVNLSENNHEVSDHYGIVSDFWVPAVN